LAGLRARCARTRLLRPALFCHDETDAREQFALVPLDLGYHATFSRPRFRLVLKAVGKHLGFIRRSPYWAGEQVLDLPLQNGIGLDANGVVITFFLQQMVQCRIGKGRIAAK